VFLDHLEDELSAAEQQTPDSLEDPERQRTLYACLACSVQRLSDAQRDVLRAAAIFQGSFPVDFAAAVMEDMEGTPVHLQELARLALLGAREDTFAEGTLRRYELHPMVRWYAVRYLPLPGEPMLRR
jgi:predicted ATPase